MHKKLLFIILTACLFSFTSNAQISSSSSGGVWSKSSTWVGKKVPGKDDNVTINGNVILDQDATVKSLTINKDANLKNDDEYYAETLTVNGKLTNNGTITVNPKGGGSFFIVAKGDVNNNGVFKNYSLKFSSEKEQIISGTTPYEVTEIRNETKGKLTAGSDLSFKEVKFEQSWAKTPLDMKSFKLTAISYERYFSNGVVYSNGEIDVSGYWGANLDGKFTLVGKDTMKIASNITANDEFNVGKGKVVTNDDEYYAETLTVNGKLTNNGTITTTTQKGAGAFYIVAKDDVYNYGVFKNYRLNLYSEKGEENKISGLFDTKLYFNGKNKESNLFLIESSLISQNHFELGNYTDLTIAEGGLLDIKKGGIYIYGNIDNKGEVKAKFPLTYTGNLTKSSAFYASFNITNKGEADSVTVSVSNTTYPSMSSSIKRWWSFEGNKQGITYYVTLEYDDSILNGQNEDNLEVFITPDKGETWHRISSPINKKIDKVKNTITLGSTQSPLDIEYGDMIISSGEIAEVPQISLSISGRKNIRVGPPNRYTVDYWNNSNFATDDFFIELNTNSGVHIMSVTTKDITTGESVKIPIDSLTYGDVNNETYLYVKGMQPQEIRSFEVILGALPDNGGTTLAKPNLAITFTAAAIWLGGILLEDYVSNVVVEGCYEMWRPVKHNETLKDASVKALTNSMKKAATVENGVKSVAKKGVEKMVEATGKAVAWPAFLAMNVYDCLKNSVKGMKDYVNGNFDKKGKKLTKVTSWDPNEKVGPTGFGEKGYMAESAPMSYTILFENKKEATAPAWKIIILDTLDENVYDVTTVEFGKMSHDMGKATRNGNILKWEFVNIELPPNKTPPEGEGYVKFRVNLKPNLPTGTEIKNTATITFDLNKPIKTNVAINTLDFEAPKTVTPQIVYDVSKSEATFNWSVDDKKGSGGKITKLYYSKDGAPFRLGAKSETNSTKMKVKPEIPYKFYFVTEDNVGNIEKEYKIIEKKFSDIEDKETLPSGYKLHQNYPNPFNPKTTISYELPSNSNVNLSVYNILGQLVKVLVNDLESAGYHKVEFDANNISSGAYYYRIKARAVEGNKEFIEVKKLLLLK